MSFECPAGLGEPGDPLGEVVSYRIAVVAACPFPCPRGTPIRILRMAEALARRGHDVHVVTYPLAEGEADQALTIHRTPRVPTYNRLRPGPSYQKVLVMDPLLALLLRRVLRTHAFDLIHAHHVEGLMAALAVKPRGLPVVFDAHTLLESELPAYRLGLPRRWLRRAGAVVDCMLPRRADHIVAVTDEIRSTLVEKCRIPSEHISVIGNGVDARRFSRSPNRPGDSGPPAVVFAGNLAPYQGVELLLQSFRKVLDARPDAQLVLAVQDETQVRRYRPLIGALGLGDAISVRRTPFPLLPSVLSNASVAVNPRPPCPGLPMKVLNYMAAGLPIVSFAGSAKGLKHGQTGWIVPDGDPGAFAVAVLKLLHDPALARRLGERARAEAEAHLSWDAVSANVEDVYRSLGLGRELAHASLEGRGRRKSGRLIPTPHCSPRLY